MIKIDWLYQPNIFDEHEMLFGEANVESINKNSIVVTQTIYNNLPIIYPSAALAQTTENYDEKPAYILIINLPFLKEKELEIVKTTLISADAAFLKQTAETWITMSLLSPQEIPRFIRESEDTLESSRIILTEVEEMKKDVEKTEHTTEYDASTANDFISSIEKYLRKKDDENGKSE